jgi:hypothetical protein
MNGQCRPDGCGRGRALAPWWQLAAAVVVAGVAALLLVAHARQPSIIVRGGSIEVEYTTADTSAQRAAAHRCGADEGADLTPTHVRYAVTAPGRERDAGDCLRRAGIVRAVAILG